MTAVSCRWVSRCARHVAAAPAGGAAARWLAQAQLPEGGWTAPAQPRNDPHAQRPLPLAAHAVLALIDAKVNY